jgi:hypothetical protein
LCKKISDIQKKRNENEVDLEGLAEEEKNRRTLPAQLVGDFAAIYPNTSKINTAP